MDPALVDLCVTPVQFRGAQTATSAKGGKVWAAAGTSVGAHLEWSKARRQSGGVEDKTRAGSVWLPPDRYTAAGSPTVGDLIVLPDGTERPISGLAPWSEPFVDQVDHYVVTFGAS